MRARKVDDNHTEIVATIRAAGFSVHDTSAVGQGFPDLVCGYGGRTFLVEVKDGSKSPSRRRLTAAQADFLYEWEGQYQVIDSAAQASNWCNERKMEDRGIDLNP